MSRSYPELMGLEFEAERLVRMGESRAEVSRRLGVHPQTLAGWALRGGWRRKDLERERATEATRETILAIRRGNTAVDAEQRVRGEVAQVLREALRLMSEEDGENGLARALKLLETAAPALRLEGRLEPARVTLAPDPLAAGMRSLGDSDVDRPGFGEVENLDEEVEAEPEAEPAPEPGPVIEAAPEPEPAPVAAPPGTMMDEAERWMDEAERLAAAGEMEAASRALNAAGRMRRLAKTLAERAAERGAREAAQSVDYLALLREKVTAIKDRILAEAAAKTAAAGAADVDEACGTPEPDED